MPQHRSFLSIILPLAVLCTALSSCSSELHTIYKTPPAKYEKLGRVSGTGTGSLGIVGTVYYVIPMGLNSRVERAYADALSKAPGATSLIDVTYEESWYWWLIGTARKVTISGEAIKEIK
ncbi:MAG: hypothetical protein KGP29_06265 [Proteobacteria bacterium]|nr:hypothetical protein [Pseudomonadota bacterium]